jgi:DNA-binding IclR family transcriptional regulator
MDKTLIKGVHLLQLMVESARPWTVSGLSKALGLQGSNVHRTLQTWCALGVVAQSEKTGEYHCTLKLFEWGCKVAGCFDVRRLAREHLLQLAHTSQETIHLSVLEGAEIVYLDKIDSPQPVRAYSEVGGRAPAHCVATGKALLAYGDLRALDHLPNPLPCPTSKTIGSLEKLKVELVRIRACGYATNFEEWREGVHGLGAVIFDASGVAVAAVGLSAPASRMGDERVRQLGQLVWETAQKITRALGGRVQQDS